MNTKEALQQLEELVNRYKQEVETLTMEQLHWKPDEDEWSIGQVIQHLIHTALNSHLRNVEKCMTQSAGGDEEAPPTEKTKDGEAVFELGAFPPVRIRVPAPFQSMPEQPETKEELIQGLDTVVQRMKETEPSLANAPERSTVSHPRLGGLNAKEWFLLIAMHYRHHLMQLDRLKQEMGAGI